MSLNPRRVITFNVEISARQAQRQMILFKRFVPEKPFIAKNQGSVHPIRQHQSYDQMVKTATVATTWSLVIDGYAIIIAQAFILQIVQLTFNLLSLLMQLGHVCMVGRGPLLSMLYLVA